MALISGIDILSSRQLGPNRSVSGRLDTAHAPSGQPGPAVQTILSCSARRPFETMRADHGATNPDILAGLLNLGPRRQLGVTRLRLSPQRTRLGSGQSTHAGAALARAGGRGPGAQFGCDRFMFRCS